MSIAHQKKQHFVPKTYLKSWGEEVKNTSVLYALNLKDNLTRKQTISQIARQNNLYTLPEGFSYVDPKIMEKVILNNWEKNWYKVVAGLRKNQLSKEEIDILKGFVIAQSFRTPKFIRENLERIKHYETEENVAIVFAFLVLGGFPEYVKNCSCEVLYINDIDHFICSDNPATHWLFDEKGWTYVNGIACRNDLHKNTNYRIVCPLTPKHLAILTPNLGIDVPESQKDSCAIKRIDKDAICNFNKMIEFGADKLLFAKNIYDLVK
jgi:hypothetical protein